MQLSIAVALALAVATQPAKAQELSSRAFQVRYDGTGITSLKRIRDVADTPKLRFTKM